MDFGLLGPLRVVDGDREILLPRQKHRALLALLLFHAGEVVSVDRILDELWGERPPATAKNALQNYVSQLRKLIGHDVLRTDPSGYVVDVEKDDVDVNRFEQMLREARAQAAPERVGTLERALALWRGPALAGLEFEPFAIDEAPRLEELRAEAQEELLAAEISVGRHGELIPRLEDLVARHPLRERLRGQLMLALYRSGRQAEALTVYQDARRTLVDELGIEPGPNLRALEQAILRQDPALAEEAALAQTPPRPADLRERRGTVTVLSVEVTAHGDLDAERHHALTTRAFNELRAATEYHGGTVERLAGDELLAVFGVPERHEDDALRAVRAALQIRSTTRSSAIDVRIALETGEVVVPGPALRASVAGAAVTRAKRLAEAAPPGDVVASAATLELLGDAVDARELAALVPRGSTKPVPVFRIAAVHETTARRDIVRTPLVARRDELGVLRSAFDDVAASGRGAVFTVLGDAGVGKTRLAVELVNGLADEARVVVGRCVAYGTGATWLPLREIAQTANVELEPDATQTIEGLLGGGAVTVADAFWAVRRLLEAAARERPAVVVLEDLHWAAPTFLDFVEQLAESPANAPAFVLCLARPELAEDRPRLASLTLEPLSDAQTAKLVAAASQSSIAEATRTRIAEVAEGNPFFAEQLVAYAHERGIDALKSVPPTVDALLASRLDRLDAEMRSVLQRAAVVGREFWQAALLQLTPALEIPAVGRHLDDLVRTGLVRAARSSSAREDAFRFHHVLIRDVAYASLPKAERADLHEAVAEWLDDAGGAEDEIVGYHLEQAYLLRTELAPADRDARELASDAGARLGTAGIRAWKRCDAPATSNLLRRAVALAAETDPLRAEFLCELGIAQRMVGDRDGAQRTLEEAVSKASDTHHKLRAELELVGMQLFADAGRAEDVLELASIGIPAFERVGDDRALGRAWLLVGYVHGGLRCQNAAWEDAAERALEHYRRAGWPTFASLGELAAALFHGPTRAREAIERCKQLLTAEDGDRASHANVATFLAALEAIRGRKAVARQLLAETRKSYEELGQAVALANHWAPVAADVELIAGKAPVAEQILAESCEVLTTFGEEVFLANRAADLADVLYVQRRYADAEVWAGIAQSRAPTDDVAAGFSWRTVRAKLLARAGDLRGADSLSLEALALVERTDALNQHAKVLIDRAELLLLADDFPSAATCYERALDLYEQKDNLVGARQVRKLLESLAIA